MKKIPTTAQLKKRLDTVFSKYIRQKYANDGVVNCVTCGNFEPWKDTDAGHFVSRQYLATRYDERNVFPQCRSCNRFHEGRKDDYSLFLIQEFGVEIIKELTDKKWETTYNFPYEEKIEEYKNKIKDL